MGVSSDYLADRRAALCTLWCLHIFHITYHQLGARSFRYDVFARICWNDCRAFIFIYAAIYKTDHQ
jgi:hypothetical protein